MSKNKFYTEYGYCGLIEERYMEFATEEEYEEYIENSDK